jgi:hypothetical protein
LPRPACASVIAGERFGADGIHAASGGRRLLGCTVSGGHCMFQAPA